MPNPTNAHTDQAIVKLLRGAPQVWASLAADDMTVTDEQALRLLTGAALVEQRLAFRLSLIGHPMRLEVTATATGEYGLVEAMEPVLRQVWDL